MAKTKIILVTGPESVGKTALCLALVGELKMDWVSEYARGYIESLNRDYTFKDVEVIARKQIQQFEQARKSDASYCVFDTGLIVTKVWFDVKFGTCPTFVLEALDNIQIDHVLLCEPDLPWVEDAVRENGGDMRQYLFELYQKEIAHSAYSYSIVSGIGRARLKSALLGLKKNHIIE